MNFKQVENVAWQEIREPFPLQSFQGSITVRSANLNNSGASGHGQCLVYAVGNIAEPVIIT